MNRLQKEQSLYLRQHAENPVDWYPWGEEAFRQARTEDKPVFLSIGYSTCHWCHVMARESFEDPTVAELMNETFVSVKVDREERPDIDQIYMRVCQMLTGRGGWPLTVIMTPEKKPFYAATYIPRENRFGMVGMLQLIPRVRDLWENNRDKLLDSAGEITRALQQTTPGASASGLGSDVLDQAFQRLTGEYDSEYGGFGQAPKFPSPHTLLYLLRYWHRSGNEEALEMVSQTLRAMRHGGLFDHLGFGFHRYSTDRKWLVPHFEKMLYDQAMLAMAYTEAYQVTGDSLFAQTAGQIFEYAFRELQGETPGFYAAQSAESGGEEGRFYLWETDEIHRILNREEAELITELFSLDPEGNFQEEKSGNRTGKNILHQRESLSTIAEERNLPIQEAQQDLSSARRKLMERREYREHPETDQKILTDWNGLMIAALSLAGRVFGEDRYTEAARDTTQFILGNLRDNTGRLLHRYIDGEAAVPGFLSDYAFLCWGLSELYETTFNTAYFRTAINLTDHMVRHFRDEETGGFYYTPDYGEELPARQKDLQDGALPSSSSVTFYSLVRLALLTGNHRYSELADSLNRALAGTVKSHPTAYTMFLSGLNMALGPSREVVIAGDPAAENTRNMIDAVRSNYHPNTVLHLRSGKQADELSTLAPFTTSQTERDGQPVAYICQDFVCNSPTTDVEEMLRQLETAR